MTRAKLLHAVLAIASLAALLSFVFPLFVNNPLHLQGVNELRVALALARVQSRIEWITGIAGLLALLLLPRRTWPAWWMAGLLAMCTALAHVDVYSLIFHHMDRPEFDAASRSALAGKEKVLAIRVGSTARAYPVRILAYHHVVNDVAGGVPLAATW